MQQESERMFETNKSYMNNKQLSLKEGMKRKKETMAGEDDMTWDWWYHHPSKRPWRS